MDFVNALDPASLILLHSGIAFLCSPFNSPVYNLPIFLYGLYAQQYTESYEPLRIFSGFVGVSILFDIIWLSNNEVALLIKVLLIVNWLLKIPTFLSLMVALRQRGDRFGNTLPGASHFDGNPQTVWTMPTPSGLGTYSSAGGDRGADVPAVRVVPSAPSPAPAAPTMPHTQPPRSPRSPANHNHDINQTAPAPPPPGTFTI